MTSQRLRAGRGATSVTTALIAINVVVWLAEMLGKSSTWWVDFMSNMVLMPANVPFAPWTLITSGFAHDWTSPLHLALNMYSLYIFGQAVEPLLGRWRYLSLYMVSLLAGGVSVLWLGGLTSQTVGASGAIFGLMAAYAVFLRSLGQPSGQMLGLIAFNLIFGFMNSGISWQGHVGGLLGGALVAWIYGQTRKVEQQSVQKLALAATVAVLIVLSFVRITQLS
ncbi:MAG: rhomboid family intramembrane serine protease [Micrococcales bacterium]